MEHPQPPPPGPGADDRGAAARGRDGARSRIVTPEAVALDLQTATVATRGLAALLDVVLQGLLGAFVATAFAVADVGNISGTFFVVAVLVAILLIRVGYPVLMETRFGATVGHMAMGLRVVTTDGAPIRARQAVARVAVGMFELDATLGAVALLVAAIRHDGRRLGDLAAGTQVVSTRVGTGTAAALDLEVPPRLRAWASSLDTTGLGRPERTALRRYLGRAGELSADRRDTLAADLADRLLPRLAAERPAATSAHDALVAIAATINQRSEEQRGERGWDTGGSLSDLPPPAPPSSSPFEPPA